MTGGGETQSRIEIVPPSESIHNSQTKNERTRMNLLAV